MKILVTGGTGFIGQWLIRGLHSLGEDVVLLYRGKKPPEDLLPFCSHTVRGDVTDPASLAQAVHGVDCIYHLAAVVAYDPRERALMEAVNVEGTRNILEAALSRNVHRFIHLSSVVAVGAAFHKNVILNMGYFETKRQAEDLVLAAARDHGLEALCLNPSTVYGPGDAVKGSRKMQVKVARGELKFYPPGGVNIVHIEDVVHCLLKALNLGQRGERYILSGENLLIRQVFIKIASIAGVPPPRIKLPKSVLRGVGKIGDLMNAVGLKGPLTSENAWAACLYHWFDSSKAQQTFGFQPKSADKALKDSVDWMENNGLLDKN